MGLRDKLIRGVTGVGPVINLIDKLADEAERAGSTGAAEVVLTIQSHQLGLRNDFDDAIPRIVSGLQERGIHVIDVSHADWSTSANIRVATPVTPTAALTASNSRVFVPAQLQVEQHPASDAQPLVIGEDARLEVDDRGIVINTPNGPRFTTTWEECTFAATQERETFWAWEFATTNPQGEHRVLVISLGPFSLGMTGGKNAPIALRIAREHIEVLSDGPLLKQYNLPL